MDNQHFDDWHQSAPEEQGVDAQILSNAYEYLVANFQALHTIVIVRHGHIIFEKHNPYSRENFASRVVRGLSSTLGRMASGPQGTFRDTRGDGWNTRSVTKSILSALVGVALREKWLTQLDQELGNLLPNAFTPDIAPEKKQITLRQLLTMTSGLQSMEGGANAIKLLMSRDWTHFMLRLPLESIPGTRFDYNSANPHLISAILTHVTGKRASELANEFLFRPLGICNTYWEDAPEGVTFGGGNLYLSPRDMAKIGLLYLNNGNWRGQQVVPSNWITESLQPYQEWAYGFRYGYFWYLKEENAPARKRTFMTYSAAGAGGQKILIIPDLDLVLAITARTNFVNDKGFFENLMIGQFLIPAIRDIQ